MAQAKKLGFDAIEVCVASSRALADSATQAECEDIGAKADELGMEIASVTNGSLTPLRRSSQQNRELYSRHRCPDFPRPAARPSSLQFSLAPNGKALSVGGTHVIFKI
jgi:hypothetical protein